MTTDVFITGLGKFFPGPPIPNDEIEDYLGLIHGRPARAKARVLAQNGIQTRHYALDKQQRTLFRNSEMAANAVRDLLALDVDFTKDMPADDTGYGWRSDVRIEAKDNILPTSCRMERP